MFATRHVSNKRMVPAEVWRDVGEEVRSETDEGICDVD